MKKGKNRVGLLLLSLVLLLMVCSPCLADAVPFGSKLTYYGLEISNLDEYPDQTFVVVFKRLGKPYPYIILNESGFNSRGPGYFSIDNYQIYAVNKSMFNKSELLKQTVFFEDTEGNMCVSPYTNTGKCIIGYPYLEGANISSTPEMAVDNLVKLWDIRGSVIDILEVKSITKNTLVVEKIDTRRENGLIPYLFVLVGAGLVVLLAMIIHKKRKQK